MGKLGKIAMLLGLSVNLTHQEVEHSLQSTVFFLNTHPKLIHIAIPGVYDDFLDQLCHCGCLGNVFHSCHIIAVRSDRENTTSDLWRLRGRIMEGSWILP